MDHRVKKKRKETEVCSLKLENLYLEKGVIMVMNGFENLYAYLFLF